LVDPRPSIITKRLDRIGKIIAVSSGKGGVGKSLVATTLALELSKKGFKVGLFDIDFTSPSTHIILGVKDEKPTEEKGLVPPVVAGLSYMSLVYYSGDCAAPLRGAETSNALIELLAVTQWGELDFLIFDMPPGIGDAVFDLIRLIKGIRFLIVTTSSKLAFETVKKQISLLQELRVPIVGIVENMKMTDSKQIEQQTIKLGLKFLAEIPYDPKIETAIGHTSKLLETVLAKKVKDVVANSILKKEQCR
jgi:ATP-binding protein involved in chromosome partitioning